MKLLKIKVPNGYKMLEKGFEVNFLTRTRVDKKVDNNNLIELEPGLYYPISTIFIGKNSSGKTTVLELISLIFTFIISGRISTSVIEDRDDFSLEFVLYHKGFIYIYNGSFIRPKFDNNSFLLINNESLKKTTFKKSYNKDLSNITFLKENLIDSSEKGDTSGITKFNFYEKFMFASLFFSDPHLLSNMINIINEDYGDGSFDVLVKLFDDSIESIKPTKMDDNTLAFKFKRVNQPEMIVNWSYLLNRLSSGTVRGIYLFAASLISFKYGGDIIIDEIEKSFNKNLIENLIMLFNDKQINKMDATLIYSTHYSELLDFSNRCDNINVLHREKDVVSIKNMCTDYKLRTELSKSKHFDQNTFDNLVNYERLMDLRRILYK
ncbi:MAG: ATP/GTP-binding protein [Bacilli bacterium]